MIVKTCGLIVSFLSLLVFSSNIYAQTLCTRTVIDPNCSSGESICSGEINSNGICDISQTKNTCTCVSNDTSTTTPNTPTPPPTSSVPSSPSTPSETSIPTPNTNKNTLQPDEQALQRLNQGLLPKEVSANTKIADKTDQNFLQSLTSSLKNLFGKLFGFTPSQPEAYSARGQNQSNSYLPQELQPKSGNPVEKTQTVLGGQSGFYSVGCPDEIKNSNSSIKDSEKKCFESNFPEGIHPVTGQ